MVWVRNDSHPVVMDGQRFRSGLEAKVARQLTNLGIAWQYELPVHEGIRLLRTFDPPVAPCSWYLPDFTILGAGEDDEIFSLPTWVEVKPADLLYAFRDYAGLEEYFEGEHTREWNAKKMYDAGFKELAKPKRCAEMYEDAVLVVYQINATRSLSVEMFADVVVFSRQQPCVNYKKVCQDQRRQEKERQWEEEHARRQAEWEAQDAERRRAWHAWQAEVLEAAKQRHIASKFPGDCWLCGAEKHAFELVAVRKRETWYALCRMHLQETITPDGDIILG